MKIALISPIEETVPPKFYGGIEWIIFYLAKFLSKKNHQVYLFTVKDSPKLGEYNIIPIYSHSIRNIEPYKSNLKIRESAKFISLFATYKIILENNFDIIHNHAGWRFLLFQEILNKKIITTLHGPLSISYQNIVFEKYKDSFYISISNNQRKDLPQLNFIKTIYNGIDINDFPFQEKPNSDRMLFFARFSPEKGADLAIKTAIITKRKLTIGAKIDSSDLEYYQKNKSLLENENIKFEGEVDKNQKSYYYQNAKLLIAPICWEEPFGLMFTESMACGTPVVAFARGSVPEVIKDGETGFIVNSSNDDIRGNWIIKKTGIEGLCEAVERIYSMPEEKYREMRRACRAHVEKHFTVERMVDEYEKVYQEILNSKR
ncbi:MAG: glycosyl transferase [Patescibacteria group bacterium]|nr:MAG: glycosyl transferase [Patescibacteria group bacterium]